MDGMVWIEWMGVGMDIMDGMVWRDEMDVWIWKDSKDRWNGRMDVDW
jgi:hypothetical protein